MKIGHITTTKYHQFQDFTLDLTYPKGHLTIWATCMQKLGVIIYED